MDIRYLETLAIDIFWKELHQTLGGIVPHSRKFRTGNNMFLKQSSCNLPCFMFYVTSIHELRRSFRHFRKTFQSLNLSMFEWLFRWLGPKHCPPSKNIKNRIEKKSPKQKSNPWTSTLPENIPDSIPPQTILNGTKTHQNVIPEISKLFSFKIQQSSIFSSALCHFKRSW